MKRPDDLTRLRAEYEEREHRFFSSDVYSWFNPANLFILQGRQRAALKTLKQHGFIDLSNMRILEMGCGDGGVLTEYLGFGASPKNIFGVDLLFERLLHAQHRLPGSNFANADGSSLPYRSGAFDLVLQYTAISSILNPILRQNICADMLRVLKPGGLILSYDFWFNPINKQTKGLRPKEIRILFPGCQFQFQRITLAPPIARRLAPVSWGLCYFLESLLVLNTHYLVSIQCTSVPNFNN